MKTLSIGSRIAQRETIKLIEGPAYWLRVIPEIAPKKKLITQELKQKALALGIVPLLRTARDIGFVRGEDSCGFFPVQGTDTTYSVAYLFNTGEVWVIDAWLSQIEDFLELDDRIFSETLERCATVLGILGIDQPYKWIAGMEGLLNRRLALASNPHRNFGRCVVDRIEIDGTYEAGGDSKLVLVPFFEEVFDGCGAQRPSS